MARKLKSKEATAAQEAKAMHVSRRSLFYARKIMRSGEQDLIDAVEQGTMKLHAAIRELERRQHPEVTEQHWLRKQAVDHVIRALHAINKLEGEHRRAVILLLRGALDKIEKG